LNGRNGHNYLTRLVRFLARPELVIHKQPTAEDLEAEKIMLSVVEMYGSADELKVIKWGEEQVEWVIPDQLPALKTVGSIFHGLNSIRRIAAAEKHDWERAQAAGARHF
jgi:hypothetical protein